jgi:hypothetical protein
MGYGRWDDDAWSRVSKAYSGKKTDEIFTARGLDPAMSPDKITVREARDSVHNPHSTPIVIGVDVTGSMGILADNLVRTGLGVLFREVYDRRPVPDPQILTLAIGDARYDRAPVQVGQFEADLKALTWLERIYLEHGGGGNNTESYELAYYFARYMTSTDSFEKRNQPGFLFTLGDEDPTPYVEKAHVKKVFGKILQRDIPFRDLVDDVRRMYIPYHIVIAEGNYAHGRVDAVRKAWGAVMGESVVVLEDHTRVAELIVSLMQLHAGTALADVASSWSGGTGKVVSRALQGLSVPPPRASGGDCVEYR